MLALQADVGGGRIGRAQHDGDRVRATPGGFEVG